ncbi:uncharacterized protein E5676_scaffold1748G00010 [Cucumis melo var. makuwa]|uniref:Uncharacterized protein n=1 Tax=Cucumis melo var. makuwa TaxID=1194695 RepID=A0A5D3C9H5_CUCMM|nr:uncharacterized protein E5676_scaffold1748G00010 [Cucumis melo var. makuwa]
MEGKRDVNSVKGGKSMQPSPSTIVHIRDFILHLQQVRHPGLKKMVHRSKRCLGLGLKHIKSNKDDPIVIEDNAKMNEGETSYDVSLNFSSEFDEVNLPIAKRRLFERVLKGKGKATETENVSKKGKLEKVVKGKEENKNNSKKLKKK